MHMLTWSDDSDVRINLVLQLSRPSTLNAVKHPTPTADMKPWYFTRCCTVHAACTALHSNHIALTRPAVSLAGMDSQCFDRLCVVLQLLTSSPGAADVLVHGTCQLFQLLV